MDWFKDGWERVMQRMSDESGLELDVLKQAYNIFSIYELTDYDVEKDVVREFLETE